MNLNGKTLHPMEANCLEVAVDHLIEHLDDLAFRSGYEDDDKNSEICSRLDSAQNLKKLLGVKPRITLVLANDLAADTVQIAIDRHLDSLENDNAEEMGGEWNAEIAELKNIKTMLSVILQLALHRDRQEGV
jgi:hypothetical protein